MKPRRFVRSRMLLLHPLSSSSSPGRRGWTGAMLAGCKMGLCSTPSPCPGSPAAAGPWLLAFGAMACATRTCTALMFSASPLRPKVSLEDTSLVGLSLLSQSRGHPGKPSVAGSGMGDSVGSALFPGTLLYPNLGCSQPAEMADLELWLSWTQGLGC